MLLEQLDGVRLVQPDLVQSHLDQRVDLQDRIPGALRLGPSDVGLAVNDLQPTITALAAFRSQYDAWLSRYNAAATAQGAKFDPTLYLQQREDLVQSMRDTLKRSISAKGMLRFDTHVQTEKKFMKVAVD